MALRDRDIHSLCSPSVWPENHLFPFLSASVLMSPPSLSSSLSPSDPECQMHFLPKSYSCGSLNDTVSGSSFLFLYGYWESAAFPAYLTLPIVPWRREKFPLQLKPDRFFFFSLPSTPFLLISIKKAFLSLLPNSPTQFCTGQSLTLSLGISMSPYFFPQTSFISLPPWRITGNCQCPNVWPIGWKETKGI